MQIRIIQITILVFKAGYLSFFPRTSQKYQHKDKQIPEIITRMPAITLPVEYSLSVDKEYSTPTKCV